MARNKPKEIFKRLVGLILIISFIFPSLYLPFTPTKRAEAFLGIGDINIESIPVILQISFKIIAQSIAQKVLNDMVKKTIDWANSGFDGNPGYTIDLKGTLIDIADASAGEFLEGTDLSLLCSPFKSDLTFSLQNYYNTNYSSLSSKEYQCTISGIVDDIESYYKDFNKGGWEAWFSMTQKPTNNPYGAFLTATADLDSRIASKISLQKEQLSWNKGFMSWSDCEETNPPAFTMQNPGGSLSSPMRLPNPDHVRGRSEGACLKDGPIKTPGSVISSKLEQSLGSGMSKLISADDINALISAFLNGLLQRYVFSERGLFESTNVVNGKGSHQNEVIDLDADGIPDGWDYNRDGILDICHHGLRNPEELPSNLNCIMSKEAGNSTYFIPICEELSNTIHQLTQFKKFVEVTRFDSAIVNVWLTRTTNVANAAANLMTTFDRYEVSVAFMEAMRNLGTYEKWISDRVKSLITDHDLKDGHFGGLGDSDEKKRREMLRKTNALLTYLNNFQVVMGKCDNPDLNEITKIPKPDLSDPVEPGSENNNPDSNDPFYDPGTGFNEGDE